MIKILDKYSPPHEQGVFGAIRKYDIHTGVDLYCEEDSDVYAIEDGVVMAIEDFTGPQAESPWWNDTKTLLIEGGSGVILYGEIETHLKVHDLIITGDKIGKVKTVLKEDKGLPMTMLHVELYKPKTTASVIWSIDAPQPEQLVDITPLLQRKGIL